MRRLTLSDIGRLREIRLRALAESPSAFSSTYEREAAYEDRDWERWFTGGVTLAVEGDDGRWIGMACGVPHPSESGVVQLFAMWVDPDARGSGAADLLVNEVVGWARSEGAGTVRLGVEKGNDRARRLYERHGFEPTGTEVVRQRDGMVEVEMERRLR